MSFVSGTTGNEAAQKFLEVLQNDFKNLSQETKKKYPQIKEVSRVFLCECRHCEGIGEKTSELLNFAFRLFAVMRGGNHEN